MDTEITKSDALAQYKNQAALAEALGVTRQAVSKYPYGPPLPELWQMKLRFLLKPEVFGVNPPKKRAAHAQKAAA